MKDQLIGSLEILNKEADPASDEIRISLNQQEQNKKRLYIESYGCQMNFSDSEIVTSILQNEGYAITSDCQGADLILLNTCAIRENAELKIRHRLGQLNTIKAKKPEVIIGVLGCMAERLKSKLLDEEKMVDLVVGPDAYRDIPNLISNLDEGSRMVNVFLSTEETYADISPVRLHSNGVTAFISIMRGCDNMCSFCVVPFTRGRERSRDPYSILNEAKDLFNKGYREVTLLGQNVDSYKWSEFENNKRAIEKKGINEGVINFSGLLEMMANVHPDLRVRFSTSHPKDITDEVLQTIKLHDNICNYIHLPVQSGSSQALERMNRTYSREWYLERIEAIKRIIGEDCGISSDMISGFCSETEEEHLETLSLMEEVKFDFSYMFAYSERPGTLAAKKFPDNVPEDVKKRRLSEIIALQKTHSLFRNKQAVGKTFRVLIEGTSKKSDKDFTGRSTDNKVVVFPRENFIIGQYVDVEIQSCTSATLLGKAVN